MSSCHYLSSFRYNGRVECSVDPNDVYEASKYSGEVLSGVYHDACVLDVATLRATYIYGPGMPWETALYTFLNRAFAGEEITLYNGGADSTDFLYVDDLVCAFEFAIDGATGEFVVGSGERTTMSELADTILDVTETRDAVTVNAEAQTREPTDFYVHPDDVDLGYCPAYGIRDGIEAMIDESDSLSQRGGV